MKIDKIVFSTSDGPEYSPFWNFQSLIWSSMGIEPICLLWGDRSKTNLSEKFGKVIEKKFLPNLPEVIQITWSKFDFPKTEPNTTWMIGDIDMLPLQKKYFIDQIKDDSEDWYLHLNAAGISVPRRGKLDAWMSEGPTVYHSQHLKSTETGCDLPGHYHVAKGRLFEDIYNLNVPFKEQIERLTKPHYYGSGPHASLPREEAEKNPASYYWCAEENYSSEKLYERVVIQRNITFKGYCYNNHNFGNRIDRSHWNEETKDYTYDPRSLGSKVDVHCARPYEKQEAALLRIIEQSGILK
jgi:hypothetical protein